MYVKSRLFHRITLYTVYCSYSRPMVGDFLIRYVSDANITLDNGVGLSPDKPYPQIVFVPDDRTIWSFVDQIITKSLNWPRICFVLVYISTPSVKLNHYTTKIFNRIIILTIAKSSEFLNP
jgi:hypothetical protein